MKQLLLFLVIVSIIVGGLVLLIKQKVAYDLAQPIIQSVMSPTPTFVPSKKGSIQTSVFVPYWAFENGESEDQYDQYLYFGITPDASGIEDETGAARVNLFFDTVPEGKETLLVLRMVDPDVNTKVLKDKALQAKIIKQTVAIAQEHGFSGVVLDLELNALPFEAIIGQITAFTKALAKESRIQDLSFHMTMYGDAFYRVRPFEIKTLAKEVDTMLLMAYDFHKSRGNPGPNFPLKGRETFGYDYEELTADFLGAMPAEKVSVVFGMFGYDWKVDNKGNATSYGEPLTYRQIQQQFIDSCEYQDCVVKRDSLSQETKITYTDENNQKHIVWFEDRLSAQAKQEYMQQRGVNKFSYWAYSYY